MYDEFFTSEHKNRKFIFTSDSRQPEWNYYFSMIKTNNHAMNVYAHFIFQQYAMSPLPNCYPFFPNMYPF